MKFVKGETSSQSGESSSDSVRSVRSDAAETHRTLHGAIIGTPNYMAPE